MPVTDPAFVRECIDACLKGKGHRRDARRFIERHPGLDRFAREVADDIRTGEFHLPPITYHRHVEPISGKVRIIGRETIEHQIHDYVAARALMPLFHAKIGRWQTASIPGRGINDARKAIRKWVKERDSRVFVKLDVVKCYPSIDRAVLKTMLAHDVGDRRLLRLVFTLVDQYRGDRGLNIGSYLSQWLANYYLSAAWHYAEGSLSAVRRSRRRQGEEIRRRLVTHVLFYADDILLIGRSKRDLTIAVKRLRGFLRDRLHLEIHPTWNVKHIGAEPIDMVGYTFRPGRTGVRPAIFLRAERAYSRAAKRPMTMAMARKCISYYGWLYHSDSVTFRRRHDIDRIFHQARHVVSAAKTGRTTQ